MGLIQRQIWGLWKGFSLVYPDTLTVYDFYLMNLSGDLIDLEDALGEVDRRCYIDFNE